VNAKCGFVHRATRPVFGATQCFAGHGRHITWQQAGPITSETFWQCVRCVIETRGPTV